MVENIGGIRSTVHSYKEPVIAPQLDDKLTSEAVAHRSIRGLIATDWREKDGKLFFNVTIPANTTARVALPASSVAAITEAGHALAQAPGVQVLRVEGWNVVLSVGSGHYAFAVARAQ